MDFTFSKTSPASQSLISKGRTPFVFTSEYEARGIQGAPIPIICALNPNQVDIQWRPRGTHAKNLGGFCSYDPISSEWNKSNYNDPRYYTSSDVNARMYDPTFQGEATVRFSFNSGSLLPFIANVDSLQVTPKTFPSGIPGVDGASLGDGKVCYTVPVGIYSVYNFFALLDEPATFWDPNANGKDKGDFVENMWSCIVSTRAFPDLTMTGFWDPESIGSLSQTSDENFNLTWEATFVALNFLPSPASADDRQLAYETQLSTIVGEVPATTSSFMSAKYWSTWWNSSVASVLTPLGFTPSQVKAIGEAYGLPAAE